MNFLRKYNTTTKIYFTIRDFWTGEVFPSHSFESGDCKISLDGGGYSNSTNTPVEEGSGDGEYSLTLSAAELLASTITIKIEDQTAIKVFADTFIVIETYGNASARIVSDLDALATSAEIAALDLVVDGVVTTSNAIDAKTTNLPANPAAAGGEMDLIDSPNSTAINAIAAAILASTGVTVGGDFTFAKLMRVLGAVTSGKWQAKVGSPGTYEILDCDDASTPVVEIVPGTGPRGITIL